MHLWVYTPEWLVVVVYTSEAVVAIALPSDCAQAALSVMVQMMRRDIDKESVTLLVLDLPAAFDAINHGILLVRLWDVGVGRVVWR